MKRDRIEEPVKVTLNAEGRSKNAEVINKLQAVQPVGEIRAQGTQFVICHRHFKLSAF
jgi:hypothetical protein